LALTVLTLNQSFCGLSLSFTGSPIHPPPLGALSVISQYNTDLKNKLETKVMRILP
jgi:hypothetical protein